MAKAQPMVMKTKNISAPKTGFASNQVLKGYHSNVYSSEPYLNPVYNNTPPSLENFKHLTRS